MLNDHMQNNQMRKQYPGINNENKGTDKDMIMDALKRQQQIDDKARSKESDWRLKSTSTQAQHEQQIMRDLIDQFDQQNHQNNQQYVNKDIPTSILSPTNLEVSKKRNAKRQSKGINGMPLQVAQIIEEQVIKRAKYNDDNTPGLLL